MAKEAESPKIGCRDNGEPCWGQEVESIFSRLEYIVNFWRTETPSSGSGQRPRPPKIGGRCNDPAVALVIPTGEEEKADPPR